MKKLYFTSLLAMMVAPAVAAPTHTSSTFPSNGVMEEDYTYQNQATATNLKVSSGTATTTAQYDNCPAEYPNSDAGAESTDECYKSCALASHATTMTGKDYYNTTDTCAIESCDTGYYTHTDTLADKMGTTATGTAYAYINHSGTYANGTGSTTQATYGISEADTFGVNYGTGKGRITGRAMCASDTAYKDTVNNNNSTYNNPTTATDLTANWDGTKNCFCKIDSYTLDGESTQSVSAPWVFRASQSNCANNCARYCARDLQGSSASYLLYRAAVFNSVGAVAGEEEYCKATQYTVTLNRNGATTGTSSITATYDATMPSITVPKQAGNVFAGYYDTSETTGGTEYYTAAGASARNWDKPDANPTLYARWTECSAGSYCPGNNTTQSCPNDYPSSAAGAGAQSECYRACSTSQFAHSESVSGNDYYGYNGTTCTINCETGYTLNPGNPDLTTLIGVTEAGTASAFISKSGTTNGTPSDFGITANNTWGVDYGTGKGKITGKAISSSQNQNGSSVWNSHNLSTSNNVTADGGAACWCKLDSYISSTGVVQSISAPWALFTGDTDPNYCAYNCAEALLSDYENYLEFRSAVFAAAAPTAPSCNANTIAITWADADQSDIDANEAGQCTYGGDIHTPKKAVHKPGKIFTGWTFNTPSGN